MTRRFIFADTSVLLNFICAGEQDLLLKFVGNDKLHVPAAVNDEMHRKLEKPRFQCGSRTWSSLVAHDHVHVLDDDMDRLFKHIRLFAGPRYSIQVEWRRTWDELSIFDVLAPFETTRLNDRTIYRARKKTK